MPITVFILTKNEAVHLRRSLPVLSSHVRNVWIIDSFSTDETERIAKEQGAIVIQHRYEYHAQQIAWALDVLKESCGDPWLLFLNADEIPDDELWESMAAAVSQDAVAGYYLTFKVMFMNRWIKYGGYYPLSVLRLVRNGRARCEDREMDEKLSVDGATSILPGHVVDDNRKGVAHWVEKHVAYARREAADHFRRAEEHQETHIAPNFFGNQAERRRYLKRIWDHLPLFWRATWYYWYRIVVRSGWRDGRAGLIWHFIQAYWYRYLVDTMIYERKQQATTQK